MRPNQALDGSSIDPAVIEELMEQIKQAGGSRMPRFLGGGSKNQSEQLAEDVRRQSVEMDYALVGGERSIELISANPNQDFPEHQQDFNPQEEEWVQTLRSNRQWLTEQVPWIRREGLRNSLSQIQTMLSGKMTWSADDMEKRDIHIYQSGGIDCFIEPDSGVELQVQKDKEFAGTTLYTASASEQGQKQIAELIKAMQTAVQELMDDDAQQYLQELSDELSSRLVKVQEAA